ncbi:DUF6531 domain-containing protein [Pseudomonas sp. Irchel 3A5]|uniref:DUF6531 domain-containing protein n=1 Tax=Pseudomonas sp. Irchel 3A5 TaxID=2008911 RepID=UPI0021149BBE|nr:DUF6531 domain-containing protein [Pseudomonas sp. Irchel 3A5]
MRAFSSPLLQAVVCSVSLGAILKANAVDFSYWKYYGIPNLVMSEVEWCEYLYSEYHWKEMVTYYDPSLSRYAIEGSDPVRTYHCGNKYASAPAYTFGQVYWVTISCENGSVLDRSTGACSSPEQKGRQDTTLFCSNPSSFVGNPINASTGNKYEEEVDFELGKIDPIVISRFYNSTDGRWRHSYSDSIFFGEGVVVLEHSDGRQALFAPVGNSFKSNADNGTIDLNGGIWTYSSPSGSRMIFSSAGTLEKKVNPAGLEQKITYEKLGVDRRLKIQNSSNQNATLLEDPFHQPKTLNSDGLNIKYDYDIRHYLISKTKSVQNSAPMVRKYHYELPGREHLLTGITDERGIRFATWEYDNQNRGISSQHSNGAGRTQVSYNADGSSIVTNELGKQALISYVLVGNLIRISSIKGEPSPNCAASNSSYTYNDRGQILTKTDAKGVITTYTYNERGMETQRTEATGTGIARTFTTDWDASRSLPIRTVGPNSTIYYRYDDEGRELSRETTAH